MRLLSSQMSSRSMRYTYYKSRAEPVGPSRQAQAVSRFVPSVNPTTQSSSVLHCCSLSWAFVEARKHTYILRKWNHNNCQNSPRVNDSVVPKYSTLSRLPKIAAQKCFCEEFPYWRDREFLSVFPLDMRSSSSSPPVSAHRFGFGGGVSGSIGDMSADSGNCGTRGGAGSPTTGVAPHHSVSDGAGSMSNATNTQSIADYLAQLLKDKKALSAFPNVFLHLERLLDDGKTSRPYRYFRVGHGKKRCCSIPFRQQATVNLHSFCFIRDRW